MKGIYIVAGYPDLENFKNQIEIVNKTDISFVEIGIPFNDPVADGPVIADAIEKTVKKKYSIDEILEIAKLVNKNLYVMTYANIIYRYGVKKFSEKYKDIIKGLIIADLPNRLHDYFYKLGLFIPIIPFVTMETRREDFKFIKRLKGDFIYFIGMRGTTGGKVDFENELLIKKANEIKKFVNKNFIIGFGIKSKEDTEKVTKFANGFVIGTELVKRQHDLKEFEYFLLEIGF
jgi:tryptophan synthase alpha chain